MINSVCFRQTKAGMVLGRCAVFWFFLSQECALLAAKRIPPDSFALPTEGCPCPFSFSSFQTIKTLDILSNYLFFWTPSARVQCVPSWIRASNDGKTPPLAERLILNIWPTLKHKKWRETSNVCVHESNSMEPPHVKTVIMAKGNSVSDITGVFSEAQT